jgi:hypothetical protein
VYLPENLCKYKYYVDLILDMQKRFIYQPTIVDMDNILIATPSKESADREIEEMRARVRRRLARYA